MRKLWTLLRVQRLSLLGINKLRHSGKSHTMLRLFGLYAGAAAVALALLGAVGMYAFLMGTAFDAVGQLRLLLPLYMAVTCLVTLVTTLYKASGTLFLFRDYDLVMSLPVPKSTVVASRLLMLYGLNFVITLLILVPTAVVYAILAAPGWEFPLAFALTLPFVPLLPILIASVLGTLIGAAAARFRRSNLVQVLFSMAACLLIVFFSGNTSLFEQGAASIGQAALHSVAGIYPPVTLYLRGLYGDWLSLVLFCALSAAGFALFCWIVGRSFTALHARLSRIRPRGRRVVTESGCRSPFAALFVKELRRYFSSALYVMNTAFGMVLLLAASVALLFVPDAALAELLSLSGLGETLRAALPLAVSFVVCMTATSASSISLEGKNFWIVRTAPVRSTTVFGSKIAVNLLVIGAPLLPVAILLPIGLRADVWQGLGIFAVGGVYGLFTAVFGLFVNLKCPMLDWKVETAVIKQSFAAMAPVLAGICLTLAPLLLSVAFATYSLWILLGATAVVGLLTLLLWLYLVRAGDRLLLRL